MSAGGGIPAYLPHGQVVLASPVPQGHRVLKTTASTRHEVTVDFRVMPRLRLGVSAGVTLMPVGTTAGDAQPPYVDPGIPPDAGSIWSLRLGGRGEFFLSVMEVWLNLGHINTTGADRS